MTTTIIDNDKAVGMFVGAAVGDALGWPQENRSNIVGGASARQVSARPEFRGWLRNGGTQYARYQDPVQAGEYSDDTQLMLAVARSCQREDWFQHLTMVELPFWPTYQRGGGGAVLTASRAWGEGHPPWVATSARSANKVTRYFDAGGNGVAMRVAPHAVVTAGDLDEKSLVVRVIRDGITTHGHPRALVGAALHALVVRHALRHPGSLGYGELLDVVAASDTWRDPDLFVETVGDDWINHHLQFSVGETRMNPARLWERTCAETDELLQIASSAVARGATANDERALAALGVFDKSRLGAGTVCAVAALYVAARTAPRPMSGLLRTAFLVNADTDTIASMTGSTLGALHGSGWLNGLLDQVQDRSLLIETALELASFAAAGPNRPHRPSMRSDDLPTASGMKRWVRRVFEAESVEITPDGRPVVVQSIHPLDTRSKNFCTRARLETSDGQTLVIDRVSKTPASVLPPGPQNERTVGGDSQMSPAEDSSPSRPTASDASEAASVALVTVELRVVDLPASERFFAEVLGMPCVRIGKERAAAGPILRLSQAKADLSPSPDVSAVITVAVPDLASVERRAAALGGIRTTWSRDDEVLWLLEPGGNVIRAVTPLGSPSEPATVAPERESTSRLTASDDLAPTAAEVAIVQEALFEVGP